MPNGEPVDENNCPAPGLMVMSGPKLDLFEDFQMTQKSRFFGPLMLASGVLLSLCGVARCVMMCDGTDGKMRCGKRTSAL